MATGKTLTVVVTGANSGVGFGICQRVISEFLDTRSTSDEKIHVIPTTRSKAKADDTVRRLVLHLSRVCAQQERKTGKAGTAAVLEEKVEIEPLLLDLGSLVSVKHGAEELNGRLQKRGLGLDVLICNAGVGGWDGFDWGILTKQLFTQGLAAVITRPMYKKATPGKTTRPQLPSSSSGDTKSEKANGYTAKAQQEEEPPLGEVFCSNVLGHYMLGHWLAPSLSKSGGEEGRRGRMIWVSSLEAYARSLNFDDFQALGSVTPYESSKRLTDVLALTSCLPATQPYVSSYFSASPSTSSKSQSGTTRATRSTPKRNKEADADPSSTSRPELYLSHPGYCGSAIFPAAPIFLFFQVVLFEIIRFFGSYWHVVTAWSAAVAPTWLALTPQKVLDGIEGAAGKGKWGSTKDRWGNERAVRTEVVGWGFGGKVGEKRLVVGRWDEWTNSVESLKEFEELGKRAWEEMERLREEWEGRLENC